MCPEMAFFHGSRTVFPEARLSVVSANEKAWTSSRVSNPKDLPWDGGFAMYKSRKCLVPRCGQNMSGDLGRGTPRGSIGSSRKRTQIQHLFGQSAFGIK